MEQERKIDFNTKLFRERMYEASKEFGDGIWVTYNRSNINMSQIHPSGKDFISFDYVYDFEELESYKFDNSDISGGIYDSHPLKGKTLEEILNIVGKHNWDFE